MEFDKLLETRRSVRAFDETKKVSESQIRQLVEAGIQAPSWKNSQTARYYCVLSDEMKKKLSTDCLPEFNAKILMEQHLLLQHLYQTVQVLIEMAIRIMNVVMVGDTMT